MIEVHLYGNLREKTPSDAERRGLVYFEGQQVQSLAELLQRLSLDEEQISHIFYNAKLLVTRNNMAPYLGYQQVRADPFQWDLNFPLRDGDRIGLFGRDMPALVV